jgi:hypothetical protein
VREIFTTDPSGAYRLIDEVRYRQSAVQTLSSGVMNILTTLAKEAKVAKKKDRHPKPDKSTE